ncbi:hypothetical protein [Mucilaginibacter antarcticus]|uniref:Uncharacterized protein n=1 Tax=Mucilaginibacter antarcticus TaxID=1855725 RepID=A0ABW5XJ93_9SPHI
MYEKTLLLIFAIIGASISTTFSQSFSGSYTVVDGDELTLEAVGEALYPYVGSNPTYGFTYIQSGSISSLVAPTL